MGVRRERTEEPGPPPAGHQQVPRQAGGVQWYGLGEAPEEGTPTITFMGVGEATYVGVAELVAVLRQNAQRPRREGKPPVAVAVFDEAAATLEAAATEVQAAR